MLLKTGVTHCWQAFFFSDAPEQRQHSCFSDAPEQRQSSYFYIPSAENHSVAADHCHCVIMCDAQTTNLSKTYTSCVKTSRLSSNVTWKKFPLGSSEIFFHFLY